MNPDFALLNKQCNDIRNMIIDMAYRAGSGHCGGSLSAVEIIWTLYSSIMNVTPENPSWEDRDRFVLSKGHGAPALYAALAKRGFFDESVLSTLRSAGSILQGHPDMKKCPGVDMSTGSLGMGISAAAGMALAGKCSNKEYHTWVLVGDGELQEGQNWEAMATVHKYCLTTLTIIVDKNGVQLDGRTDEIMPMLDVGSKIREFGFDVRECDGHDCESIYTAVTWAAQARRRPRAIVADTVKGKGVSFMEGQSAWHGKPLSEDDYAIAKRELQR
jgi:transketolase